MNLLLYLVDLITLAKNVLSTAEFTYMNGKERRYVKINIQLDDRTCSLKGFIYLR